MNKEKKYLKGFEGNWTREICSECNDIVASPKHYEQCMMGKVKDLRDITFIHNKSPVPIKKGDKIEAFFNLYSEEKGFWSWVGDGIYDAEWNSDNYIDELFESGYDLAIKADGKPVFQISPNPDYSESWTVYFIGTEDEILDRLKAGWKDWKERHPSPSDAELKRQEIDYEIKDLKSTLKKFQFQIQELEHQKELLEEQ